MTGRYAHGAARHVWGAFLGERKSTMHAEVTCANFFFGGAVRAFWPLWFSASTEHMFGKHKSRLPGTAASVEADEVHRSLEQEGNRPLTSPTPGLCRWVGSHVENGGEESKGVEGRKKKKKERNTNKTEKDRKKRKKKEEKRERREPEKESIYVTS
jgi:hypothetical protein